MASNVVKLRPEIYQRVREKARAQGSTMQEVIAEGLDALERVEFARAFQRDYEALRADADVWQDHQSERAIWDAVVGDGLDD